MSFTLNPKMLTELLFLTLLKSGDCVSLDLIYIVVRDPIFQRNFNFAFEIIFGSKL